MKPAGIGKYTRFGITLNLLLMVAIALAVGILINVIASAPMFWLRWDLTAAAENELSPQTEKVLANLQPEVEVLNFYKSEPGLEQVLDEIQTRMNSLLLRYRYASHEKVRHRFFQLDRDYGSAKAKLEELGIKSDDNLVVVLNGKGKDARKRVLRLIPDIAMVMLPPRTALNQDVPAKLDSFRGEEALLSAILSVTAEKKEQIGFLTQHGELSIKNDKDPDGLYQFADVLRFYGYEPVELDLSKRPEELKSVSVLVAMSPKTPLGAQESALVRNYLLDGGRLFLALDPNSHSDFAAILQEFGIEVRNGVVREPVSGHYGIPQCAYLYALDGLSPIHPITRDLRQQRIRVFFNESRAFELNHKGPKGMTYIDLASTGMRAWEDLAGGTDYYPDSAVESVRARTLAMVCEKESENARPRMRIVVAGTSSVAANQFFADTPPDFALNSVSWLANRENLISVSPKKNFEYKMNWTEGKKSFFFWFGVIGFPFLSLLAGFLVWMFRRK